MLELEAGEDAFCMMELDICVVEDQTDLLLGILTWSAAWVSR